MLVITRKLDGRIRGRGSGSYQDKELDSLNKWSYDEKTVGETRALGEALTNRKF